MRFRTLVALLLCITVFGGCGVKEIPAATTTEPPVATTETQVTTTEPIATTATNLSTESTPTSPAETTTATLQTDGTLMKISLETQIWSQPNYDSVFVQLVGQDGVYTIVETASDGEGNLWGRLKSGIGWIDLTALAKDIPVSVFFAEERMQNDIRHSYVGEPSEYASEIVFRAREELGEITFSLLAWTENGLAVDQTLYAVEQLSAGEMFAAKIVFYGDMTTYGIAFTDSDGLRHSYAVSVSGRNGMLILTEY